MSKKRRNIGRSAIHAYYQNGSSCDHTTKFVGLPCFYGEILGMSIVHVHGRYAIQFGNQKLNIHTKKAEFLPAATHPTYGSLDLCFVVDEDIQSVKHVIEAKGYPVE